MSANKKVMVTGEKISEEGVSKEVVLISIERRFDGVVMRIMKPDGKDVIEPILLPFSDAKKLGRILISTSDAGRIQMELILRKIAEMEYEIRKMSNQIKELVEEKKRIEKQEQSKQS